MNASMLVNLIDSAVMDFGGEGMDELVTEFAGKTPSLLRSSHSEDFELALRAARIISFAPQPNPREAALKILLDVGFASVSRARAQDGMPLVERAIDIAQEAGLRPELRRAFSVYAALNIETGIPARAIECAVRANAIATELDDPVGMAAAHANLTAALHVMGLYRECISVADQLIQTFSNNPACAQLVAAARANLASSAIALQNYRLGADTAKDAVELLGLPRDHQGIFTRLVCESNWLKCAIGLDDDATATARLKWCVDLQRPSRRRGPI